MLLDTGSPQEALTLKIEDFWNLDDKFLELFICYILVLNQFIDELLVFKEESNEILDNSLVIFLQDF